MCAACQTGPLWCEAYGNGCTSVVRTFLPGWECCAAACALLTPLCEFAADNSAGADAAPTAAGPTLSLR